jgi:site-specific recombinase XerD
MAGELVDPRAAVLSYLEAEKAGNTRRAYRSDWADFCSWCDTVNLDSMPAEPMTVARYLAQLANSGRKTATIQRRVAAIRAAHKAAGHEPPTNAEGVKGTMRGIRRTLGTRKVKKAPATAEVITRLQAVFPDTLAGIRDRALVLLGFAAALRRSELVALDVPDVDWRPKGIVLNKRRSKTDQEGRGALIPVPRGNALRPVDALEAWLSASGITSGPLFRSVHRSGALLEHRLSDRDVARIVKRYVAAAGIDAKVFSGHSLRAGFVTSALDAGVDPFKIMPITGHVKVDTLQEYDRRENDFASHAGKGFL